MQHKATAAVIAGGVFWGVISFFIKPLSAAGMTAIQISCIRLLSSALLLGIYLAIRSPEKLKIHWKDIWIFPCTGIGCIALCNTLYAYTIIQSEASIAVVLLYTSPVFILVLSALFFRERITKRKFLAVFLNLCGCILVAGLVGGTVKLPLAVFFTGLGSAFSYGMYTILSVIALKNYSAETLSLYTFLFGGLGLLPFGRITETAAAVSCTPSLLLPLAGLAVVSTVLAFLCYTWGLHRMDPGRAGILVAVEPFMGAMVGILFYDESCDLIKLLGILMILAAVILMGLPEKKPITRSTHWEV